jgi:hypothetical protein
MAKGIFIVLVATAFVAITIVLGSNSAITKFSDTCRKDGIDSRVALDRLIESGFLVTEERLSDEILRLYVVDQKWNSMDDDQRVDLAYHGYCLGPDGQDTVLVISQNSQRVLYSVVGGNPRSHVE